MTNVTKNEYSFLKLCKKHFSYDSAQEIKLDDANQVAYHIPIQSSIQQILSKPDVLNMLIKNYNETVNRNSVDTDLMYHYRHGSQAKDNIILRDKPDSLLFQLYIDEIGLTNPLGAKKDTKNHHRLFSTRRFTRYCEIDVKIHRSCSNVPFKLFIH